MIKISVIVPVYNTSKYLIKCLDSIKNQTMKDIEILIVNDGSTDNSKDIIMEYIEKNSNENIKYLEKENGGLSDARNFGVKYAKGKYIAFVDSDDYIDIHLFENLEKYIDDNVDIIKYKLIKVSEDYDEIEKIDGPIFEKTSGEDAYKRLYSDDKYLDVAWLYLYSKEFWIENDFKYNADKIHENYGGLYHEDFGLTSLVLVKAKNVVSTNIYGYYYMQSDNSITRNFDYSKNLDRANDLLIHYDEMIRTIKKYTISENTIKRLKSYYTNTILLKIKDLKKADKKIYIGNIKKRNLYKNIQINNFRQLIKKILLYINVNIYLKFK